MSGANLVSMASSITRVLICDDSAVARESFARLLESDPAIRVVARSGNGRAALDAITRQPVDVVVLDIEMPIMDGITALPMLVRAAPGVRVIMASRTTQKGANLALRALRDGAADFIAKPGAGDFGGMAGFRTELLAKVKGHGRIPRALAESDTVLLRAAGKAPRLIAVACSTGGPRALFTLVRGLAARGALPVPVVITQHMPANFMPILADHLEREGGLPCAEAQDAEALAPGRIYLAPGGRHLLVDRVGSSLQARLSHGPPENFCRPAADAMLRSAAQACGGEVFAVVLTGMGRDGLGGVRAVVESGGTAIAQDEASSVVWGMPGSVAEAGLCHAIAPVPELATCALDLLGRSGR